MIKILFLAKFSYCMGEIYKYFFFFFLRTSASGRLHAKATREKAGRPML